MSSAEEKPPRLPRDIRQLRLHEAVLYDALVAFFELTGHWRAPAPRSGDLEEMRLLDKVYWFYKSANPIRRAVRGSGLEGFFAEQAGFEWTLPKGFTITESLRLSSAGDLMNHAYLAKSDGFLYRDVAEVVFGADVSMANLECVVRAAPARLVFDVESGPRLALDAEAFRAVSQHDSRPYDFLATACNHSLDFGEAGVASTIEALRQAAIAFHGVNEREEDSDRATILEKRGFRIGVVAHTFGLNAHRPPANRPRIVNRMKLNGDVDCLEVEALQAQLRHCERSGVDFVVAHLHWGMEFESYPRPQQIEVAHRIAELGVDAIVGHHPHVLQPVEHYRTRRDPMRVVPIFYSLGNLTNPFSAPYMCRGGVARIELVKGATAGQETRTYVRDAELIEVEQVADNARGVLALRPVAR